MLRVVYDHQVFSWQKYGGISRYIYEVATHLAQSENIEVKILAIAYVNEYLKSYKSHNKSNLIVGFPIPYTRNSINKLAEKFNEKFSAIWLKKHPHDILHKTYYSSQNLVTDPQMKVVITVHDMIHEKFNQFFNSKKIFNIQEDPTSLAKKEAVQQADRIICVSENTKKDLIEILNVDPNKISVVYHGYSLNSYDSNTTAPNIPHPYILYVGDRGTYKNFKTLLQAYANSSQLRNNFHFICFGSQTFSSDEINNISELGLPEGKVIQVSGDDKFLASLYQNAALFVYPSLYEGFGMPLLEAMALNCPVACSNTSSIPEVVGEAAKLFDPNEPENIAEVLENILFSTEVSKKLIQLGAERIKLFSWESCAEQTKQVYLSLL
ncbi:glycosyltransferase family 1 protein [Kamptonema sp. UHCC 0994]|uniref:glycosyltransferase family 4 protein n=1 Tax=Kamptonema sp. UHCC 0994 TaxID=3031329 RepID=UPI0023B9D1D2|nr:glycosyltransferase family 1 protein [Kamptonema sp. UHCC 0994]MDF0551625.1 glycosyltransferase family 1 protein [Kamptonema sp. UHCC 0994]